MTGRGPLAARPWTAADDGRLKSLALKGASARLIAAHMSGTTEAVRSRASRLNILLRQARPQKQIGLRQREKIVFLYPAPELGLN